MQLNRTHKIIEKSPKLRDLLRELRTLNDTPSLINWITEDADRVNLAGKLASVSEANDPASFQWLVTKCGRVGLSVKDMQDRIRPVARALGLYGIQQNINYYQLLGVNQDATEKEIRTAFRTRARRIHPDTRGDDKMDKEAFVALNKAYKTLSNPILRQKYNQEINADGIWNEGSKSQKHQHKKRRKSKVKFIFLFSVILLFLAGTILFSDVFFNMSAMQDINEQLLSETRKANGNSENNIASNQSIQPTGSDPSSSQPSQNEHVESVKRSRGKDVSSKLVPTVNKQDSQNLNQAVELSLDAQKAKKQDLTKPDNKEDAKNPSAEAAQVAPDEQPVALENKKQATGISESKGKGRANTLTKRSEESVGPIDKQMQARLQSEIKVLDLIKDPPTRDKLQSFLNRYTAAYQSRNENRFFNFFTPDAIENERPISSMFPIYRQTFRDFENIDYRIHLKEYVVDLNETAVKIKGEYRLDWNSRQDGARHSIKGNLSMSLVTDKNISYKIEALSY